MLNQAISISGLGSTLISHYHKYYIIKEKIPCHALSLELQDVTGAHLEDV